MKKLLQQFAPFFGLIFVLLLFLVLAGPQFLSFYNVKLIVTQTVIVAIAALGMTLVIVSGGIDLSVGSQIALGTVACALVLSSGVIVGQEMPEVSAGVCALAVGAAIAICAAAGTIIGLFTARFKIVPFIVTLGMMQIARGFAKYLASEQTVATPDNALQKLMLVDPQPEWLVVAPGVWVAIILTALTWFILKYTVLGRYIFAIGSNEKTAVLCGINVPVYRTLIYALNGCFVGVASVLQYSNLSVGDPTAAAGTELDIIAAVVIGGGSLSGGEGSAMGSITGALIMASLRSGCSMLGVPNYVQEIIIGCIIVGAVGLDRLKHKIA